MLSNSKKNKDRYHERNNKSLRQRKQLVTEIARGRRYVRRESGTARTELRLRKNAAFI